MYTSVRASCSSQSGGKPILLSPDHPDSVKVVRTFEVTRSYLRRRSAATRWKTSDVGQDVLTSLSPKSVLNVSDVGGSSVSESLCVARPVLSSSALSSRTIWRHLLPVQSSFQTNYVHFATFIDIFIDIYVDMFIASHNILLFAPTGPAP